MAQHGEIWWTELRCRDPKAAAEFYAKTVGWTPFAAAMTDMSRPARPDEPSYTLFMKGDQPVCGAVKMEGPAFAGMPVHWFTFIAVDDVDAACREVTKAGGKIVRAPFDVPTVGRVAIIADKEGAHVGLGTPAEKMVRPTKTSGRVKTKAAADTKKQPAIEKAPSKGR